MLYVLILGLIIGLLAKFIMPGKDPGGLIVTILIGIAGSWIGNYVLGNMLGVYTSGGWIADVVRGTLGALFLLYAWKNWIGPNITKQ